MNYDGLTKTQIKGFMEQWGDIATTPPISGDIISMQLLIPTLSHIIRST